MNLQDPPRVTWRTHLSLALLALVYIFSYIDRQVVAILIEPIKSEFGASDTEMGLLTGLAFGLLYAALGRQTSRPKKPPRHRGCGVRVVEPGHRGLRLCD